MTGAISGDAIERAGIHAKATYRSSPMEGGSRDRAVPEGLRYGVPLLGSSRTTPVHRYPNVRSSELSPQSGQTVFGPLRLFCAHFSRSPPVRRFSKADV